MMTYRGDDNIDHYNGVGPLNIAPLAIVFLSLPATGCVFGGWVGVRSIGALSLLALLALAVTVCVLDLRNKKLVHALMAALAGFAVFILGMWSSAYEEGIVPIIRLFT